jgi:hypothetical protein
LTLGQGVTFPNGDVVRWDIERITKPDYQDWALTEPVDRAEVVDECSVKFITKPAFPWLLGLLSLFFIAVGQAMKAGGRRHVRLSVPAPGGRLDGDLPARADDVSPDGPRARVDDLRAKMSRPRGRSESRTVA